jgi:dTDP-4-amino-4,6-dideoxygalactose transaminase
MTDVPFLDLSAQHDVVRADLREAFEDILDSSQFVLGPHVERFERAFASACDTSECIAVNTGTSALHLSLLAAGVGAGDEVITVSLSFVATAAAVLYAGATPVMVDVDPTTWTMDPAAAEAAITPRTKAIIPVHLHGQMADVAALRDLCDRHGLTLIEDACQAHLAVRGGKRAGSAGAFAAFSFYPGKNLGACGEGGAITTSHEQGADLIRLLRDWGATERYHHELVGFNYRMDALQGAFLAAKLVHLARWTDERTELARRYDQRLDALGIVRPRPAPDSVHVYHVYAVRISARDAARRALREQGIETNCHYPIPIHRQSGYVDRVRVAGSLINTEQCCAEFVSLPMYPGLPESAVDRVCSALKHFAA